MMRALSLLLLGLCGGATATLARADALLVTRGLFSSRAAAKEAISQGLVSTRSGAVVKKSSLMLADDAVLHVLHEDAESSAAAEITSRLRPKLEACAVDVKGAAVLDIGASTGCFADSVLTAGASAVTVVEWGALTASGAAARERLADDARVTRVTKLERGNVRSIDAAALPQPSYDVITVDVSYTSLRLVLPVV